MEGKNSRSNSNPERESHKIDEKALSLKRWVRFLKLRKVFKKVGQHIIWVGLEVARSLHWEQE